MSTTVVGVETMLGRATAILYARSTPISTNFTALECLSSTNLGPRRVPPNSERPLVIPPSRVPPFFGSPFLSSQAYRSAIGSPFASTSFDEE